MASALQMVSDQDAAISMFKSGRLQILQALAEPDSAAGLSRRLGIPRQRINYHLRRLEQAGLVELVEERRKGNCMERVLRASAQGYVVDPAMLGGLDVDPARAGDRLSATFLVSLLARGIREVAKLRRLAADKQKELPTLALDTEITFGSAAAQAEFAEDLTNAINEVIARHHDETAKRHRTFRLLLASYPVPPTENDND